jgi:hypothetical protein
MKLKIIYASLSVFLACALFAKSPSQKKQASEAGGISVRQLRNLVNTLPPLPGTIQAIRFLQNEGFQINRTAILTDGVDSGWQIFVFHLESTGKFALEWKSGRLDGSFAVSSADQFQSYFLSDEQVLKFSGCAAHACPDVFSVMLYVPSKKTAFTATYTLGKVTYTPSAGGPMYQYYKMDLDRYIAKHRSVTN